MQTLTRKDIPNIEENVPLAPFTTIKIGGPARYCAIARTREEFLESSRVAREQSIQCAVIGGGSNVLVADSGFSGLVIIAKNDGVRVEGDRLRAESGALLARASRVAYEHGLSGLEFGIGIPGTVGGAVVGNASNYVGATGRAVESVRILDEHGEGQTLSRDQCRFIYRGSAFKGTRIVILDVCFHLSEKKGEDIKKTMDDLLAYKKKTQQTPYPTSGCMFKNVRLATTEEKARLEGLGLATRYSEDMECVTVPLRAMLEELDMKGFRVGDIVISEANANFLENRGHATAEDVIMMMSIIKQRVRDRFGVELVEEVQRIGW